MNERLQPPGEKPAVSHVEPDNMTIFPDDYSGDDVEDERSPTPEPDVPIEEESVVDKEDVVDWIFLAQQFIARYPYVESVDEFALAERVEIGQMTVDMLREQYADAVEQYHALEFVFVAAAMNGVRIRLPALDDYLRLSNHDQEEYQILLEEIIKQSQFARWLRPLSGRFASLTELALTYQKVAKAVGFDLVSSRDDEERFAAK